MSVNIYVIKRDESPIGDDEIKAAVAKAPHYTLADDGIIEIPSGEAQVWLEPTGTGALCYQLPAADNDVALAIVDSIRRFAGCIPGAVVEAEGQVWESLPWDERRPGGAR